MDKFEVVARIIEEVADIPKEEIERDSSLMDDLDLSSLEIVLRPHVIILQKSAGEIGRGRESAVEGGLGNVLVFDRHKVHRLVQAHEVHEVDRSVLGDLLQLPVKL